MRSRTAQACAASLALASLAGCQLRPAGVEQGSLAIAPAPADRVVLRGRARFDAPMRQLQALTSDVIGAATVSLIDASGATPVTVVSGLTASDGTFVLYQPTTGPFTPTEGAFYTLEVSKRAGKRQHGLLSIRTVLKRSGGAWTSVTGSTITVDTTTTAIARLPGQDNAVAQADLIGKDVSDTVTAIGTHTPAMIAADARTVATRLRADEDPDADVVPMVASQDVTISDYYSYLQNRNMTGLSSTKTFKIDIQDSSSFPAGFQLDFPFLEAANDIQISNLGGFDLKGLGALRSCGQFTMSGVSGVTSLDGLQNLQKATGLTMNGCSDLADASALANLTMVDPTSQSVALQGDPALTTVDLRSFDGSNAAFGGDSALVSLNLASFTHDFTVSGLQAFKTLVGPSVDAPNAHWNISACSAFNSPSAFAKTTSLASLEISNANALTALDLDKLKTGAVNVLTCSGLARVTISKDATTGLTLSLTSTSAMATLHATGTGAHLGSLTLSGSGHTIGVPDVPIGTIDTVTINSFGGMTDLGLLAGTTVAKSFSLSNGSINSFRAPGAGAVVAFDGNQLTTFKVSSASVSSLGNISVPVVDDFELNGTSLTDLDCTLAGIGRTPSTNYTLTIANNQALAQAKVDAFVNALPGLGALTTLTSTLTGNQP